MSAMIKALKCHAINLTTRRWQAICKIGAQPLWEGAKQQQCLQQGQAQPSARCLLGGVRSLEGFG